MKLKQTYMIDGCEVKEEGAIADNLRVFHYKDSCQYNPEIAFFFVDNDGEVVYTLSIKVRGGVEGTCSLDVEWEKK